MSWPVKQLGDIFEIARGGSPRPIDRYITNDPNGYKWIMIGDAPEGAKYITTIKKKISADGLSKTRQVKPGDFLLTNSMSFGRPYILKTEGCIHDGWLVLSPRANDVSPDYFYYLLGSDSLRRQFIRGAAGAVVKNLNTTMVKGVTVPLPPLAEQKRIAGILDAADALRAKRREALVQLDSLLQATFLDLFGDPVTNPKGWKRKQLGKVAMLQRGFDLPVQDRRQGVVPIYAANGPVGSHDSVKVKGPGVVTGRSGTLGKVHYIEMDFWPLNTALWVKNFYGNEPLWVLFLLRSMTLEQFTRGAGVPTLNRNLVHVVDVPVPPIELQQRFAEIVVSIEQQISVHRAHLSELDTLFASLQSRAFGGEL